MKPKLKPLPPGRTLADSLRRAILESGMTHYQLAQRSGIDRATLGRFCSGESDLKLSTASAICIILGLKLVESGRSIGSRRKPELSMWAEVQRAIEAEPPTKPKESIRIPADLLKVEPIAYFPPEDLEPR